MVRVRRTHWVMVATVTIAVLGAGISPALANETPTPIATPIETPPPFEQQPATTHLADPLWPKAISWKGCTTPLWPTTPVTGLPGNGERVLVIGDSLTRTSRTFLEQDLIGSGWTPTVRCWGGTKIDWARSQLKRAAALDQSPTKVVIALGTNNKYDKRRLIVRHINKVMAAAGPDRQVYWVNLWMDDKRNRYLRGYTFINDVLTELSATYPNLTIVDWHAAVETYKQTSPFKTTSDGIHYRKKGLQLRARVITDALNASTVQ